jgi:hypothetical protein
MMLDRSFREASDRRYFRNIFPLPVQIEGVLESAPFVFFAASCRTDHLGDIVFGVRQFTGIELFIQKPAVISRSIVFQQIASMSWT